MVLAVQFGAGGYCACARSRSAVDDVSRSVVLSRLRGGWRPGCYTKGPELYLGAASIHPDLYATFLLDINRGKHPIQPHSQNWIFGIWLGPLPPELFQHFGWKRTSMAWFSVCVSRKVNRKLERLMTLAWSLYVRHDQRQFWQGYRKGSEDDHLRRVHADERYFSALLPA